MIKVFWCEKVTLKKPWGCEIAEQRKQTYLHQWKYSTSAAKYTKAFIYENWVMLVDVIHGHAMTLSTMSSTIYEKEFLDAQLTFKDYNGPG